MGSTFEKASLLALPHYESLNGKILEVKSIPVSNHTASYLL